MRNMFTDKRYSLLHLFLMLVLFSFMTSGVLRAAASWPLDLTSSTYSDEREQIEDNLNDLDDRLSDFETYISFSTSDINSLVGPHMIITGANVHIRNGHTNEDTITTNSLGNLIIGYNEACGVGCTTTKSVRDGSHNLIVGRMHHFNSYGGIVAGWKNVITGNYASVIGGKLNEAEGEGDVIISGIGNNTETSSSLSAIVGGNTHYITNSTKSVIVGGYDSDIATSDHNVIMGGYQNSMPANGTQYGVIVGGQTNQTNNGDYSVVVGGYDNTTSTLWSTAVGGYYNTASGQGSLAAGGTDNTASGETSVTAGGDTNTASGTSAVVSGGGSETESGACDVTTAGGTQWTDTCPM